MDQRGTNGIFANNFKKKVMKTYDVHFNGANGSDSKGFNGSFGYCKNYIETCNGTDEPYSGDCKGGTVSVVCNETGEEVYPEDIRQESRYAYDEESVKAVVHWALTAPLPREVTLSGPEHITDTSVYVRANICDINRHYPDPSYNPAIDRLYRLKEFMERQ